MKSKFLTKVIDVTVNAQAQEKHYISEFFFKCDFHVFLRGARTQDFVK